MFADELFHPDHVIPAVKLPAAGNKAAYQAVAHVLVKFHAVVGEMSVLMLCVCDAGVGIQHVLLFEHILKRCVKQLSAARAAHILFDIYRQLGAAVVCLTGVKSRGIGISHDMTVLYGGDVGVIFQGVFYPAAKILHSGNIYFKGNGSLGNVGGVYFKQLLRIVGSYVSDSYIAHLKQTFHNIIQIL